MPNFKLRRNMRASALTTLALILWATALNAQGGRPLSRVNPAYLISPREATGWHEVKAKGGPALSGNESWKNFIGFVEKRMREYGVIDLTRNSFTYDRWHTSEWPDESNWGLVINGRKIRVASYAPYSGSTGEAGVTANLVYYDPANPPKDIAGKIVIFRPRFTPELQEGIYGSDYEQAAVEDSWPVSGKTYPGDLNTKALGSVIWAQLPQVNGFIRIATQGKAAGALYVFDANYGAMAGMYTFPVPALHNLPSLYLDRTSGAQVIADATRGAKATIRLRAEVTPTETWQLIGYLPGRDYGTKNDQVVLFSTHSDGPSISQDDGPFGFLAIAKYFSNIPQAKRPRTLMFYIDNRHFMPGGERPFAAQDWLAKHPGYKDKVVAVIGMEHLGQIEYVQDGVEIKPSGRTDLHNLYVTNNDRMVELARKAVADNHLKGVFIRVPARNGRNGKSQGPWYGLGGLANRLGTPGFSIMGSMGAYWATSSASRIDRFDAGLFCRQVATFAQLTGELMIADMKGLQTAPGALPQTGPGLARSEEPAQPQEKPAAPAPSGAAAGFRQLAIDRLASDFIQDRFYKFAEADGLWMQYSVFVPRNYDKVKKWPLIVMLHGLNITPAQQARFEGVAELAEKYGYIVVCPMGYSVRSFWGIPGVGRGLIEGEPGFENEKNLKLKVSELAYRDTMNVFELMKKEFNIDDNRIYLTGHSMGGWGTYYFAARHPEIWAGVAPIAGGGIDDRYAPGDKLKALPFLVMQGEKDLIVNASNSRTSVAKMKELGIKHSYIEVAGADHEVWIRHNPKNWAPIFEFFNSVTRNGSNGR